LKQSPVTQREHGRSRSRATAEKFETLARKKSDISALPAFKMTRQQRKC
jgi:hypothetical protein